MALKKIIALPIGVDADYIKIRECQIIVDVYKDSDARLNGKASAQSFKLSLNEENEIEVDGVVCLVSKLTDAVAAVVYSELKSKHFPDAEDC